MESIYSQFEYEANDKLTLVDEAIPKPNALDCARSERQPRDQKGELQVQVPNPQASFSSLSHCACSCCDDVFRKLPFSRDLSTRTLILFLIQYPQYSLQLLARTMSDAVLRS